jgi:hypothetical protein
MVNTVSIGTRLCQILNLTLLLFKGLFDGLIRSFYFSPLERDRLCRTTSDLIPALCLSEPSINVHFFVFSKPIIDSSPYGE